MTVDIICGDAREALARFPDGHFHCCVTSPPFWGLRDYGLEPTVWGGDGCEHEWGVVVGKPTPRSYYADGCIECGSSMDEFSDRCPHCDDRKLKRQLRGTPVKNYGPKDPTRPDLPNPPASWSTRDATVKSGGQHPFCRRCNAWRGTLGLEPTPELYVEHLVGVMREVRRVLRDDGVLWLNLGDSYASQGGAGFGKQGATSQRSGRSSVSEQPSGHLVPPGLKPKDLCGIPWMVAFALRADGWWLRSDIVWSKPNPMPESVRDRPTRSHEYLFLLTKRERYYYDQDAIREPSLHAGRIVSYDGSQKNTGHENRTYPGHGGQRDIEVAAGRNRRSVWEIATQPFPGAHFATFPEKLVEPCILAGTSEWGCCPECGAPWERVVERHYRSQLEKGEYAPEPDTWKGTKARPRSRAANGTFLPRTDDAKLAVSQIYGAGGAVQRFGDGVDVNTTGWRPTCKHGAEPVPCRVLDPLAGSGTVGLVAERLGRHSVLIDAKEEYCEMARYRTAQRGLMVGETP